MTIPKGMGFGPIRKQPEDDLPRGSSKGSKKRNVGSMGDMGNLKKPDKPAPCGGMNPLQPPPNKDKEKKQEDE